MTCRPDMLLQFAHYIRAYAIEQLDVPTVEVRADVFCRLNGRDAQRLIVGNVDLASIERNLGHADWITSLSEPLPPWPGPRRLARRD